MMNKNQQQKTLSEIWPYLKPWQRKLLRLQCEVVFAIIVFLKGLYSYELFAFPVLAFIADYIWMKRIFPQHPISELAILSTAFMSMTLTLFLLRPRKWKKSAHWVKA